MNTRNEERRESAARSSGNSGASGSGAPDSKAALERAMTLHQAGRMVEAERIYREILKVHPDNADALHLLGIAAFQKDKCDEAVALVGKAIEIDPRQPSFFCNLGIFLRKQGKLGEAAANYRRAIEIKPDYAEAHNNLGNALKAQGKPEEAAASYRRALEINPAYADAHMNLGIVLHEQGKLDEAAACYRRAIEIKPDYAEAHGNLGNALRELGRLDEAFASCRRALEINPGFAEAHSYLGNTLRAQGRPEEAETAYRRAIEIDPAYADAHMNLGITLQEQGRLEEALASHRRALEIAPDFAEAHANHSLALLITGRLEQGWAEYEWRWKTRDYLPDKRDFSQPWWDGSPLNGKKILVWGEQGVGDEVMFASMFPDLAAAADKVIVECDGRLKPLFQRSFPNMEFFEKRDPPVRESTRAEADYQIPMGSLGGILRTEFGSFPKREGYLKPDPEAVLGLREKYRKLGGDKPLVGISWRSGNKENGPERSAPLNLWTRVLKNEGCRFINLQYGDVRRELSEFAARTGAIIHFDEDTDPLKSLDDFASQAAAMDLVISIDNSTVHMSAALGRPVWTLLSFVSEWRWMQEREDTPWYSTMRLFRQRKRGEWRDVFEQVEKALREYLASRR